LGQSLLDPFPRGCLKDLVATAAQALEFFFQSVDFPFGVEEGLGEGATAAPLADEIDEVREPALLGV